MYSIILSNGIKLENLELNGNNFISEKIIDDAVFNNNLDRVIIYDGSNETEYTNMRLMANQVFDGKTWFVLGEKSPQQLKEERMQAQIDALIENSISYAALAAAYKEGVDEA